MKTPNNAIRDMAKTPNPADQPGIRKRIKELIYEKFNDRQSELVAATGIQSAALSNILNEKAEASVKQLRSIEKASKARFEWLVSGVEPKFHPLGWVQLSVEPAKEGEYLRAFIDKHKSLFTQTRLAGSIGITKSTLGDYFKTGTFDVSTRDVLLRALQMLTGNLNLTDEEVFTGVDTTTSNTGFAGHKIRMLGSLAGESSIMLPFVPLRARAGVPTPLFWNQPKETIRILRESLEGLEPDINHPRKDWWVIEIDGDSMEPQLISRSKVLAYYVSKEQSIDLKPGVWAVQFDDDFVIKRVRANNMEREGGLMLHSDNPPPDPYFIKSESIRHVWYIEKTIDSKVR